MQYVKVSSDSSFLWTLPMVIAIEVTDYDHEEIREYDTQT